MLLLLAVSLCLLATFMLWLKVDARWFAAISFLSLAFNLSGGERIDFAFARENSVFFTLTFNLFLFLYLYFAKRPKNVEILGKPAKQFPNYPLYISAGMVLFGFGSPLYLFSASGWTRLTLNDWGLFVLFFYMGVVGIFLFRRAWRLRKLRLELQVSLGKR